MVERPVKKVGRLPPRLELVDVAVDNLLKPAWREGAAAEIEVERQRRVRKLHNDPHVAALCDGWYNPLVGGEALRSVDPRYRLHRPQK